VLAGKLGKSLDADTSLLTVLAKRGGAKALGTVRQFAAGTNADLKKTAVRAMSAWADASPLKDLLAIAQNDPDPSNRVLALRGYVRLVGDLNEAPLAKVKMFQSALGAVNQPDAIHLVLSGLGNVKEIASLKAVAVYFEQADVANEAAAAALSISQELVAKKKSKETAAISEVLMRVHTSDVINETLRNQAGELLKKLPAVSGTDKPRNRK